MNLQSEHNRISEHLKETLYSSLHNHDQEYLTYQRNAFQILERDSYLKKNFFDTSDEQNREITMKQIRRVFEIRNQLLRNQTEKDAFMNVIDLYDRSLHMRLYVHFTLFKETIWSHGTPDQIYEYTSLIEKGKILGCFAMTELGHSSFLRGLETISNFDDKNDEFVITSSSLLATKWWIGMAGQTATHAVVLSQLIIKNVNHGLHWFIVPLRNPFNGELYPGITAGHLGSKAGRGGLDNGWIQFTNCRIPRKNLLQRFIQVSKNGEVSSTSAHPSLSYMTLIGERISALKASYNILSQAITISLRYSVLRQQGPSNIKILDFQTHSHFLMPILSGSYCLAYTYNFISNAWNQTQKEFIESKGRDTREFLEDIQYFHAMSAGSKSFLCWWTADALELCRRSGGGHFYSSYNAIASLIGDFGVITTGGGDNMTLAQQCSRYLLNQYQRKINGKKCHNKVQEMFESEKSIEKPTFDNLESILNLLKQISSYKLKETFFVLVHGGKNIDEGWHDHLLDGTFSSEPFIFYEALSIFNSQIKDKRNESIKDILNDMGLCFGLFAIQKFMNILIEAGLLFKEDFSIIRKTQKRISLSLRYICIPISDSFGYPDFILKSPLAMYNSTNSYEKYFSLVEGNSNVAPYWKKEVLPLTSQL